MKVTTIPVARPSRLHPENRTPFRDDTSSAHHALPTNAPANGTTETAFIPIRSRVDSTVNTTASVPVQRSRFIWIKRIAIAFLVIVIIDEGFGTLNKNGLRAAAEDLSRLKRHLKRIILVSHQEEFTDHFPAVIRLENGADGVIATTVRR